MGVATAFLAQMNGGFNTTPGHDVRRPMTTVTNTGSQQQLVTAHLAHLRGNCDARDLNDPLMTVSAGGLHHGLTCATLESANPALSPEVEEKALRVARSEEHTSELQSLMRISFADFCLIKTQQT